ncbi:hypothetical protein PROFUN_16071 [Planoprotostelium fungivorum]|uniref:Uncharacterized protein n=1 Tax=Planoprotostelium fungivorum TaxID=1890364 RepID=A0A2P6MSP3_9EUKA|nr:hypothetical protein PROFUN_16071 [Planoprotostelium fungivorum]
MYNGGCDASNRGVAAQIRDKAAKGTEVRRAANKVVHCNNNKSYGPEENLWLPEDNLSNSPDLVADFKARTARVTTSKRKRKN